MQNTMAAGKKRKNKDLGGKIKKEERKKRENIFWVINS